MPTKIPAPENSTHFRFTVEAPKFGVDATTGNLTGLQLMASGREAKGHGIWIDDETLATGLEAVKERGGRLKGYVTHNHAGACSSGPSWLEAPAMDDAANELNIPGFFSALAVKAKQLIAGEFEFYEAFKKNFAPQYEQLLEMAKKTPDLLGLSVECWGYLVFVAKDGTEYSSEPDNVELLYNGMPALRITDLWAAAFVSDGAATDGLFAQLSAKARALFTGKQKPTDRAQLAAALSQFAAEFAATVPTSAPSETDKEISRTMKIIADLKAKITDPKQFAAAMAIVGNTPADKLATLTVVEIETQLATAAAAANLLAITGERDTLKTQVGTLTTERDEWKRKFEQLKTTGKVDGVNLGAGGGAGGAGGEESNPWAKATLNRTRQAEILKTDPTRAAALKEAAKTANAAAK